MSNFDIPTLPSATLPSATLYSATTSDAAPEAPSLRSARPLTGEVQVCTKCQTEKDLCEFAIKRGGRARICRSCQKASSDAHYQRHRAERLQDAAERNEDRREVLRCIRDVYLAGCSCKTCGTTQNLKLRAKSTFTGKAAWVVIGSAMKADLLIAAMKESDVLCAKCVNPPREVKPAAVRNLADR